MSIDRLSIAGPDETVRPQELAELSDRYPFVEWSILYGHPIEPLRRFPTVAWIRELTEISAERAETTVFPPLIVVERRATRRFCVVKLRDRFEPAVRRHLFSAAAITLHAASKSVQPVTCAFSAEGSSVGQGWRQRPP
jgi:hypothetical protein